MNSQSGPLIGFAHVRGPALAGVVAPILFWSVLTILGQTQVGYSAFRSEISLLALGANGWVQTANFIVFSILIVAFQRGLQRTVAPGKIWGAINVLAAAVGLALVSIAVFPTDPIGTWTLRGAVHLGAAAALAVLLPLSCLATAAQVGRDRAWRGYAAFSVLIGVLTGVLTAILLLVWSGLWRASHPWLGLSERIAFGLPCVWMETIAIRLLRLW
ncbi:MAG TPA: DUF998 domain-containing protein [bacterium]|nr:DUF998 domain-containing protein [bacterium]